MEEETPSTLGPSQGAPATCALCDNEVSVRTVQNKYGRRYKYPRKYCTQCEYKRYKK